MMGRGKTPKRLTSSPNEGEIELRRGPWTFEEDNLLVQYITSHGEGRWNFLAKSAGLKRTGKSCRLRWLNYLKPDIRRGNFTPREQLSILELHSKLGNRWSKIAQHLPGRTDNEIKNYWRTRVQKQARQLKVDSNSKKFVEAIRQFWMPRLKEKLEQDASNSCSSSISHVEISNFNVPSQEFNHVPLHSPSPSPSNRGANSSTRSASPEISRLACVDSLELDGYDGCYVQELDAQNTLVPKGDVVDSDWLEEDFGDTFWSNDELWQF